MRKVRYLSLILGLLAVANVVWGQVLADPNDQIYRLLQMWEQEGYVGPLPSLRPYPLPVVKQALTSVIAKGDEADVRLARKFLADYTDDGLLGTIHPFAFHHSQIRNSDYQGLFGVGLRSTGSLLKGISYSARGEMMLERLSSGDVYPRWSDEYVSTLPTEAKFVGQYKFTLANQNLNAFGDFNGALFFGNSRLYGEMGLMRSSFGPFIDGPVLGPQAPLAGHFSFTYRSKMVTFSSLFLQLVAVYGVKPGGIVYKLKGVVSFFPSKNLFLNSIELHPARWLDLGLFQTAMVGARFSPAYFFPFTQYVQNYFGNWDNSFIGGTATVRLPFDLQYDLIAYVDDINLSKMLKLDFSSDENKVAIKTGLSWVAPIGVPNRLQVNYLIITPYTYTHYNTSGTLPSYLQYTNQGQNLGSVLQPNSDQWNVRAFYMPLDWLQLEAWMSRTRHGSGSVFDYGVLPNGTYIFTGPSTFLTQSVIEKDLQVGLSATVQWSKGRIDTSLKGGYTFEFVQNSDLVAGAAPQYNNYLSVGLDVSY